MYDIIRPTSRNMFAADMTVPLDRRLSRRTTTVPTTAKITVIFIHGLWLHATSWQRWIVYFKHAGFRARAPGWPDFPATVAETRMHPEFMYDQGIDQVTDYYARILRRFPIKPVLIGHSFGGLIAQKLLDRNLAAAAIAIDPAPVKGVARLPFPQIRSALPVLGHPLVAHGAVSLNPRQFRYGFANRLSDHEAAELYEHWTIPAPAWPIWQVTTASFNPRAQNKVDVKEDRAPLLLMAGTDDHTVSSQTIERVQKLYHKSPAVTDLKEWPGKGHSLVIDNGWQELADYSLEWLRKQGIG